MIQSVFGGVRQLVLPFRPVSAPAPDEHRRQGRSALRGFIRLGVAARAEGLVGVAGCADGGGMTGGDDGS